MTRTPPSRADAVIAEAANKLGVPRRVTPRKVQWLKEQKVIRLRQWRSEGRAGTVTDYPPGSDRLVAAFYNHLPAVRRSAPRAVILTYLDGHPVRTEGLRRAVVAIAEALARHEVAEQSADEDARWKRAEAVTQEVMADRSPEALAFRAAIRSSGESPRAVIKDMFLSADGDPLNVRGEDDRVPIPLALGGLRRAWAADSSTVADAFNETIDSAAELPGGVFRAISETVLSATAEDFHAARELLRLRPADAMAMLPRARAEAFVASVYVATGARKEDPKTFGALLRAIEKR